MALQYQHREEASDSQEVAARVSNFDILSEINDESDDEISLNETESLYQKRNKRYKSDYNKTTLLSSFFIHVRSRRSLYIVFYLFILVLISIIISHKWYNNNDKYANDENVVTKTNSDVALVGSTDISINNTSSNMHPEKYNYTCRGVWSSNKKKYYSDRIQNGEKLYVGEFICSINGIYKLGLDINGNFIHIDSSKEGNNQKSIYFNYSKSIISEIEKKEYYYFVLQKDGAFTIFDHGIKIWGKECNRNVSWSEICLSAHKIDYECPYLHIHDGGVVVLNWIDEDDDWNERNIKRIYDF